MSSPGIDNLKIIIQKNEQLGINKNCNKQTITNSGGKHLNLTNTTKKYPSPQSVRSIQNFVINYY